MEVEKSAFSIGGVFTVQIFDQLRTKTGERVLVVKFLSGIGRIGEQSEMEVGVAVAKITDFQSLRGLPRLLFGDQQSGNHHHGGALLWDALCEIQLQRLFRRKQQ